MPLILYVFVLFFLFASQGSHRRMRSMNVPVGGSRRVPSPLPNVVRPRMSPRLSMLSPSLRTKASIGFRFVLFSTLPRPHGTLYFLTACPAQTKRRIAPTRVAPAHAHLYARNAHDQETARDRFSDGPQRGYGPSSQPIRCCS